MKSLIKIIILQAFWYLAVVYGQLAQNWCLLASIVLVILNYYLYRPPISLKHYIGMLAFFLGSGLIESGGLRALGWVEYGQTSFPFWLTSLYIVFLCYYGDIFDKMTRIPVSIQFFLGGLGGLSAFWSGSKISNLTPLSSNYYIGIFIFWSVFFPLSIGLFYHLSKQFKDIKLKENGQIT